MPNNYYYLIASLPHLRFGDNLPITEKEFISEANKWLSASNLSALKNINLDNFEIREKDPTVIKKWEKFNFILREEVASIRRARKHDLHEKYSHLIEEIFETEDPLAKEKAFENIRWMFIEEIGQEHHFDISALMLYFLKLKILTRITTFNKQEGIESFEKVCEVASV